MKTMWRAPSFWMGRADIIRPVEVEKETDKSIWINGRRQQKRTEFDNYFDTLEEAKTFMIWRQARKVDALESRWVREMDKLRELKEALS